MYVPIISFPNSSSTIINKTVVYNDTVLPLKENGKNLCVTSIGNVEEYLLENCLNTVFESNPEVIFNTIQYSRKYKRVYFYTDKKISTSKWDSMNIKSYSHSPLENKKQILEEIKNVLIGEKIIDTSVISLYDVANLVKTKNDERRRIIKECENRCEGILKTKYGYNSCFIIYEHFGAEENELCTSFKMYGGVNDYKEINFSKNNDDLYIKKSESSYSYEILKMVGDELSTLYDRIMKNKEFYTFHVYFFKPINSNFFVSVDSEIDEVCISNKNSVFEKDFELSFDLEDGKYDYICNSNNLLQELKGNEDLIFKKIFVKIDNFPECIRQDLYEIRTRNLKEELLKQEKKEKRLALKRKLFPWKKNIN